MLFLNLKIIHIVAAIRWGVASFWFVSGALLLFSASQAVASADLQHLGVVSSPGANVKYQSKAKRNNKLACHALSPGRIFSWLVLILYTSNCVKAVIP